MNVKKRMKHLAALLAVALFVSSIPSTGIVSLAAENLETPTLVNASSAADADAVDNVFDTAATSGGKGFYIALRKPTTDSTETYYEVDGDGNGTAAYTGGNLTPTPELRYYDGSTWEKLTAGKDYSYQWKLEVMNGEPQNKTTFSDAGTYDLVITGDGTKYSKDSTAIVKFVVTPFDLSGLVAGSTLYSGNTYVSTGATSKPIVVYDGKTTFPSIYAMMSATQYLKEGTDFVVTQQNDSGYAISPASAEPGKYKAAIEAPDSSKNTVTDADGTTPVTLDYAIVKDISGAEVTVTYDASYNLKTTVKFEGKVLTDNTSTLASAYNTSCDGDTDKNGYVVKVYQRNLDGTDGAEKTYAGGFALGDGKIDKNYNIYIYGTGSLYTKEPIKRTLDATDATTIDLNSGIVTVELEQETGQKKNEYQFTGAAVEPKVTRVTHVDTATGKVTDVTNNVIVSYYEDESTTDAAIEAGVADIYVTGKSNGVINSAKVDDAYTIIKGDFERLTVTPVGTYTFTGANLTLKSKVMFGTNDITAMDDDNSGSAGTTTFDLSYYECELDGNGNPKLDIATGLYEHSSTNGSVLPSDQTSKAGYYIAEVKTASTATNLTKGTAQALIKVEPKDISGLTAVVNENKSIDTNLSTAATNSMIAFYTANGKPYADAASQPLTYAAAPASSDYVIAEPEASTTAAGKHTATITGTGNYKGSIKVDYSIIEKLDADNVVAYVTYTNNNTTPVVNVDVSNSANELLKEGTDYMLTYYLKGDDNQTPLKASELKAGKTYIATVEPKGYYQADGNAATIKTEITIRAEYDKAYDITNTYAVSTTWGEPADNHYSGSPIELSLTIGGTTYNGPRVYSSTKSDGSTADRELTTYFSGKGCVVKYYNNVDVGTATVKIYGDSDSTNNPNGYFGVLTKTFQIIPTTLETGDVADVTTGLTYKAEAFTDTEIAAAITASAAKSRTPDLKLGTDYKLSYAKAVWDDTANAAKKVVGTNNYETDGAVSAITDAGHYIVYMEGIGNYAGTAQAVVTVDALSVNDIIFTLKPESVQYTGEAVVPEFTAKTATGIAIDASNYVVKTYQNSTAVPGNEIKAVEIGDYYYTITGQNNLTGTTAGTQFSVVESNLANTGVSVASATYTGKAVEPEVTVTVDGTVIDPSNYTVTYDNNVNAGKTAVATVTAKAGSGFKGSISVNFTINPKAYSKLTVTNPTNKTYNGKALKANITVKDGSKKLVEGTDYTLKYGTNRKIGLIKVKVVMKGNYTGQSAVKTFRINLAKPSFTGKSAKKSQVSVKIKRNSLATGYQVQVCRSSKFAAGTIKAATLKKNTLTSKTFTKLSSGKTYYVRVRSYKKANGKTYYSSWTLKKIKVK